MVFFQKKSIYLYVLEKTNQQYIMKKFSLPKDGGLIEAGLPNGIKHTFERIPARIFEDERLHVFVLPK